VISFPQIARWLCLAALAPAALAADDSAIPWGDVRYHLAQNCFDCHGGFLTEGGIDLVALRDESSVAESPELFEKIAKALRIHYMPPVDHQPMPREDREALVRALNARLLAAARDQSPDHAMMRRLNREEFDATLNDLLMIDFPVAERLPPDDTGYGFDNNADVLSVSPLLMEKYLDVAADAAEWALPQRSESRVVRYSGDQFSSQRSSASAGVMHVNSSGMDNAARLDFRPLAPGRYRAIAEIYAQQAGDEVARARIHLRGEAIEEIEVPATDSGDATEYAFEFSVDGPGEVQLAIEFVNDFYREDLPEDVPNDRNMHVAGIRIEGPIQSEDDLFTPFLERHFSAPPERLGPNRIREGIWRFTSRAYRREVTKDEIFTLWRVYQNELKRTDGSPRRALHAVMDTVLTSPSFVFRIEPNDPNDEYALASWLSYFLWGTMPDDPLFERARQGELRANLANEIERMLIDPRAAALTERFAAQWLQFLDVWQVKPDDEAFPEYDDALRAAMWEETTRFFQDLVWNDRSIIRVLDADYTYANEELAELYGLPDKPNGFERVSLAETDRRGVWSQASVLTVTSHADRTSPVLRGQYVLKNLLGLDPPPPPDNVPALSPDTDQPTAEDFRASLVQHRADPNCASCHNILDPVGLALERYDAIGRWRSEEEQRQVVAETLFDDTVINTPRELADYMVTHRRDDFVRTFAEKLAIYASGRGMNWRDRPTLDRVVDQTETSDYRVSALIRAVAENFAPGMRGDAES